MPRRALLASLIASLAGCAGRVGSAATELPRVAAAARIADPLAPEELYRAHCAACHGSTGRADGPAARYLFPPARNFALARFRLVRGERGMPMLEDIVAVLRRGVPGSSMPSYAWLSEDELGAMAAYVLDLAQAGLARDLLAEARAQSEELTEVGARERAAARLAPGRSIAVGAPPEDTAALAELGRLSYANRCERCHAEDGRGMATQPRFDEDGTLNWPRDFTAGILKGGASHAELARRILLGMPGTAMPATPIEDPIELGALVRHVQRLMPPGADARLVQEQERLAVARVETLPQEPGDAAWIAAEDIEIVLAPLAWKEESVLSASLSALHDGASIALRLAWDDRTSDLNALGDATRSDAAALQFSCATRSPLAGMGLVEEPTVLWHWRSLRLAEVAGALDALSPPSGGSDVSSTWSHARLEPSRRVEARTTEGLERPQVRERLPAAVAARAAWSAGRWSVVFTRALSSSGPPDLEFRPGERVLVACAIWNGGAGDRGPEKSISIWQELDLAP